VGAAGVHTAYDLTVRRGTLREDTQDMCQDSSTLIRSPGAGRGHPGSFGHAARVGTKYMYKTCHHALHVLSYGPATVASVDHGMDKLLVVQKHRSAMYMSGCSTHSDQLPMRRRPAGSSEENALIRRLAEKTRHGRGPCPTATGVAGG